MDLGLDGKRALVTAASKGLGYAIAEAFLNEGCRVCISSSDQERISSAARRLGGAGGEIHALTADLAKPAESAQLITQCVETLGGLDILINNTGGPPTGGVMDLSDEQWSFGFESILMSAVRLCRQAIPVMRSSGRGAIVNLASLTAKQPFDGVALSNVFRAALLGMAKTLSREAAPEVRVNSIATEHVLTDRIRELASTIWSQEGESAQAALERLAAVVPMGRYGSPRELANVAVFLASDAASFVTGTTIAVDGGLDRGLF